MLRGEYVNIERQQQHWQVQLWLEQQHQQQQSSGGAGHRVREDFHGEIGDEAAGERLMRALTGMRADAPAFAPLCEWTQRALLELAMLQSQQQLQLLQLRQQLERPSWTPNGCARRKTARQRLGPMRRGACWIALACAVAAACGGNWSTRDTGKGVVSLQPHDALGLDLEGRDKTDYLMKIDMDAVHPSTDGKDALDKISYESITDPEKIEATPNFYIKTIPDEVDFSMDVKQTETVDNALDLSKDMVRESTDGKDTLDKISYESIADPEKIEAKPNFYIKTIPDEVDFSMAVKQTETVVKPLDLSKDMVHPSTDDSGELDEIRHESITDPEKIEAELNVYIKTVPDEVAVRQTETAESALDLTKDVVRESTDDNNGALDKISHESITDPEKIEAKPNFDIKAIPDEAAVEQTETVVNALDLTKDVVRTSTDDNNGALDEIRHESITDPVEIEAKPNFDIKAIPDEVAVEQTETVENALVLTKDVVRASTDDNNGALGKIRHESITDPEKIDAQPNFYIKAIPDEVALEQTETVEDALDLTKDVVRTSTDDNNGALDKIHHESITDPEEILSYDDMARACVGVLACVCTLTIFIGSCVTCEGRRFDRYFEKQPKKKRRHGASFRNELAYEMRGVA